MLSLYAATTITEIKDAAGEDSQGYFVVYEAKREVSSLTKLSPSLESEDGSHQTSTSAGTSKLGRDHSAKRIVATDTNAHL